MTYILLNGVVNMQLQKGNIWDNETEFDYVCITTNSIIKSDGTCVMGAGIALEAKKRYPAIAADFGKQIRDKSLHGKECPLLLAGGKYIAFQTKLHWRDPSPLWLVERSCQRLKLLAEKYPEKTFALPYPGISNGRLTKEQVRPLIDILPNNVTVFHL